MRSGDRKHFKIVLPIKGETAHFGSLEFIYIEHVGWVADRNVKTSISYDDLDKLGYAKGHKITLDGVSYICRIPTFAEWDLMMDYSEDDSVWHWSEGYSWVYLEEFLRTNYRAFRGFSSARCWNHGPSSLASAGIGWRPCLEVCTSDSLPSGEKTCENCKNYDEDEPTEICFNCVHNRTDKWEPAQPPRWRWRVLRNAPYWYLDGEYDCIERKEDRRDDEDDDRYESGNYYLSLEAASRAYLEGPEK